MINCYLVKKVSRKEGKEPFTYVQLYAYLGYTNQVISMDKDVIAAILECSVAKLYAIEEDKPVIVATFNKVVEGKKNVN